MQEKISDEICGEGSKKMSSRRTRNFFSDVIYFHIFKSHYNTVHSFRLFSIPQLILSTWLLFTLSKHCRNFVFQNTHIYKPSTERALLVKFPWKILKK